jgi:hypothetical protein
VAAGPWAVATDQTRQTDRQTDRPCGHPGPARHAPRVRRRAWGVRGVERGGTSQREGWMHAGIACLKAESLGVDSSGSWVEGRGRVVDPRPLGVHVGCVLRLCGLLKGMVVRRTTGRGGAAALTPS